MQRQALLAEIQERQQRIAALELEINRYEAQNLLELEQRRAQAEAELRAEREALQRLEDRLKRVETQTVAHDAAAPSSGRTAAEPSQKRRGDEANCAGRAGPDRDDGARRALAQRRDVQQQAYNHKRAELVKELQQTQAQLADIRASASSCRRASRPSSPRCCSSARKRCS